MAESSSIEWTDATWNPVTGCTKISPGCKNCYAERLATRLLAMGNRRYRNGFDLTLHADQLTLPLKWKKPRRIFVNSMSDLFHEDIPTDFIARAFETMRLAHWHLQCSLSFKEWQCAQVLTVQKQQVEGDEDALAPAEQQVTKVGTAPHRRKQSRRRVPHFQPDIARDPCSQIRKTAERVSVSGNQFTLAVLDVCQRPEAIHLQLLPSERPEFRRNSLRAIAHGIADSGSRTCWDMEFRPPNSVRRGSFQSWNGSAASVHSALTSVFSRTSRRQFGHWTGCSRR